MFQKLVKPIKFSIVVVAVCCLVLVVVGLLKRAHFSAWEKTLRGPYDGVSVDIPRVGVADSELALPKSLVLGTINAYTNSGGDEWPLLFLKNDRGELLWAYVLQPKYIYPVSKTVDTPFVKDARLLRYSRHGDQLKVLFSCLWGAGGNEKGLIYLNKNTLEFNGFSLSW